MAPVVLHDIGVYCGSANPRLAAQVVAHLGLPMGRIRLQQFPDTEVHAQIEDSVRGQDIYVIQSISPPVNERMMELLIILDAFRRASAGRLTAVVPYYGYSRQEKKSTGREPITARLVADLMTTAGANRVVSIDLHTPALQGFFNIGMDHLTAVPILVKRLAEMQLQDAVIVSPDIGRAKLADNYAAALDMPLAIIHKRRRGADRVETATVVGDVADRVPVVIDDIISTGGTITAAVSAVVEAGARPEAVVVATHGLFTGPATERLLHPAIRSVLISDTVELPAARLTPHTEVVSVAAHLAQAIGRLHNNESISSLFPPKMRLQPV